ncbi:MULTISPECIES: hypothetical protein [Exiguobacterium]|uniref:Uncharacterized protein n=1 Tax=Exiguobacterium aurantiacum TaxID=33987 RepID=A0A377FRW3_9BACL|nr:MULTISPECIES: hypothetical protein [Exiguobacterium]STO07448.1 Uncharacterised protein [Exiguobacterium aurantiacum]
MRRVPWLSVMLLSVTVSVHALSWAYAFVVLDGRLYEVMDVVVTEAELGDVVGEVKTMADDMTGRHYGDASNMYPIGTKYREVIGEPIEDVIAVEDGSEWKRAEYIRDAPFSLRNHIDTIVFTAIGVGLCIFIVSRIRRRR